MFHYNCPHSLSFMDECDSVNFLVATIPEKPSTPSVPVKEDV
jgi:hypothetical protein